MGAQYWVNALKNNTKYNIDEVCQYHVDIAIEILRQTDPDRFIHSN